MRSSCHCAIIGGGQTGSSLHFLSQSPFVTFGSSITLGGHFAAYPLLALSPFTVR